MTAELIERLRERVRDYIYDCTKDEFSIGWTLSAEQADHLVELVGQSLSDRIAVLETAVEQAAEWFEDYARQHRATAAALRQPGDVQPDREPEAKGRDQKAVTNELRAKSLRASLTPQEPK